MNDGNIWAQYITISFGEMGVGGAGNGQKLRILNFVYLELLRHKKKRFFIVINKKKAVDLLLTRELQVMLL